jgi:hypothetical protein
LNKYPKREKEKEKEKGEIEERKEKENFTLMSCNSSCITSASFCSEGKCTTIFTPVNTIIISASLLFILLATLFTCLFCKSCKGKPIEMKTTSIAQMHQDDLHTQRSPARFLDIVPVNHNTYFITHPYDTPYVNSQIQPVVYDSSAILIDHNKSTNPYRVSYIEHGTNNTPYVDSHLNINPSNDANIYDYHPQYINQDIINHREIHDQTIAPSRNEPTSSIFHDQEPLPQISPSIRDDLNMNMKKDSNSNLLQNAYRVLSNSPDNETIARIPTFDELNKLANHNSSNLNREKRPLCISGPIVQHFTIPPLEHGFFAFWDVEGKFHQGFQEVNENGESFIYAGVFDDVGLFHFGKVGDSLPVDPLEKISGIKSLQVDSEEKPLKNSTCKWNEFTILNQDPDCSYTNVGSGLNNVSFSCKTGLERLSGFNNATKSCYDSEDYRLRE